MDFYYHPASAPCRIVSMTARAVGVELNNKIVDLSKGEHLTADFIKINPQHTIPTLVDNGFSVWESRAIAIYLIEKYGKPNDALFPKDPKQRALINQRLYFDAGTLNKTFGDYFYPQFIGNAAADPELLKKFHTALEFFNTFLESSTYAAGDSLTVADIALIATLSTCDAIGIEFKQYARIAEWYELCKKEVPGFDENWEGCLMMKQFVDSRKQK